MFSLLTVAKATERQATTIPEEGMRLRGESIQWLLFKILIQINIQMETERGIAKQLLRDGKKE